MTILLRQKPLPQVVRQIVQRDNGAWFDPEDMSTMFQDAAGTTPVTALEQPVGKWLDKSGNGNHATQSITASRPTLSARYNLLTKTEDFADAVWVKAGGGTGAAPSITPNHALAPDGTMTAARVIFARGSGATSSDYSVLYEQLSLSANVNFNESIYVKLNTGAASIAVYASLVGYGVILGSTKILDISNQWVRIDTSFITTSTWNHNISIGISGSLIGTTQSADILIWHPQLNIGTTPLPYQRVNTATDYDSVGWSRYVRFDGIDDYLNLPYMGLYANGSASVILPMSSSDVAGVYSRIIAEASTVNANARYIIPREDLNTAGTDLSIVADDTTGILSSVAVPFSKEVINVRSYVDSGDAIKTYSDSSEKQSVSYSRSGKTLTLNSTLIGAQATPTVVNAFAAIKLYGLIITKSALSNTDRRRCEQFLASRLSTLGVTLS